MSKLVLDGVSKKYGKKQVLKDVFLELETGHCYGLLGRNGAGKTTLLNIIMQRVKRDGGKLILDEEKLDNNDRLMRRMFCVSDSGAYPSELKLKTVFRLTEMMYDKFDMDYAIELSDKFELDLKQKVGVLSTGYTTIYKAILALSSNADFVFLDEPVLGLDVNMRELFYRELAKKMADREACYVISTHLIEEAQNLIDRVIIVHDKGILNQGDVDELLSQYVSVSGKADAVDTYIANKQIIGTETMGSFKNVFVSTEDFGDKTVVDMPIDDMAMDSIDGSTLSVDSITKENITLQKLFYYLTGGVPNEK